APVAPPSSTRPLWPRAATAATVPDGPSDRGRALVVVAGTGTRPHPTCPCLGRDAAGTARGGHPWCRDLRTRPGRVRRCLPGAGGVRGVRPVSPRLLRRGSGCCPVRLAGSRGPTAFLRTGRPGRERGRRPRAGRPPTDGRN